MAAPHRIWIRVTCTYASVWLLVACADDKGNTTAAEGVADGPPTLAAGDVPALVPGSAGAKSPSLNSARMITAPAASNAGSSSATSAGAGTNASAAGNAGALARAGTGGSSGSAAVGGNAATIQASVGSSGAPAPAASNAGPIDYAARGPFEVEVEKNVGESHRNTNLTDDAARCAALVGGLGDDADGGDWAIYPDDMDRQLYTLFRPKVLAEGVKYPVVTWGNGTCSQPLLFEPLLGHLASHGIIVIASNWRWVAGGVEMRRALDYVLAENENPQSVLFGKIAVDKLGASGHSQGSTATVTVGADKRIVATVPIQGASAAGVGQLAGPTFLIAGEKDMTVSPSGIQSAFRAASVPAAYGLSLGHDHIMPVMMPQPILKAVTAWFRIQLADDQAARPLFYDACSLCNDPTWRMETANLK